MATFDAKLYSSRFIQNLDRRTVAREITNQNYTVRGARTVEVFAANDLVAQDANADHSVKIQNPGGSQKTMTMDQDKDLSVLIPSIEEFQSSVDMQGKFRERQVQAAEEDLDDYILGFYTDAPSANSLDTTATTASGFGDVIRDAKVAMSEQNVPRSDRFMVVSPTYADLVAEDAGDRIERNTEIETEGYIGRYQGFDIFESTGLKESGSSPTKQHQLFGHRAAITLAVQANNMNLVPDSEQAQYHGDILKALMVYGGQTFLPEALGVINADKPA
jgi:hypothetical protein